MGRVMDDQSAILELSIFKSLVESGALVGSPEELYQLLDTIMDATNEVFDAEASSLLLVEEETNTVYFKIATGDKSELVEGVHLEMGEGIAGWVAESGAPLVVNDPEGDPRHAWLLASIIDFKTKNILCVPMKDENKVTVGVIEVLNKKSGPFTPDDRQALQLLARKLAPVVLQAQASAKKGQQCT